MTPMMAATAKSGGKMKVHSFKLPSGYKSEDDSDVKEALLKFKENDDGTCEMISLDGAPFSEGSNTDAENEMDTTEAEEHVGGEENAMPEDMEGAIQMLQKRDRKR